MVYYRQKSTALRSMEGDIMKSFTRIFSFALCLVMLSIALCSCAAHDADRIVGYWRMVSFTTDDGESAPIENELDMLFYSSGVGEARIDGETLYMFDYTVKRGRLFRQITYSTTNVVQADETYTFSDDGRTLTVYSPADSATIVLQKISDDVAQKVELSPKS